jgi:hypothetical protein
MVVVMGVMGVMVMVMVVIVAVRSEEREGGGGSPEWGEIGGEVGMYN